MLCAHFIHSYLKLIFCCGHVKYGIRTILSDHGYELVKFILFAPGGMKS